jgi:REP element-mobilizing transposase RayT
MAQAKYSLDEARRVIVLKSLIAECGYRRWHLWAAHVRSDHVHVVVAAPARPEKVLINFKAYASRALTRAGFDHAKRRRWSRHGSTRYLWEAEHVERAIEYVLYQQGKPMQTFCGV